MDRVKLLLTVMNRETEVTISTSAVTPVDDAAPA
jgi:hypothetical protein